MQAPNKISVQIPPVVLTEDRPLEAEKFQRLMHQHESMREEERSRIILWLLSLTLALLSLAELGRMFAALRSRKKRR